MVSPLPASFAQTRQKDLVLALLLLLAAFPSSRRTSHLRSSGRWKEGDQHHRKSKSNYFNIRQQGESLKDYLGHLIRSARFGFADEPVRIRICWVIRRLLAFACGTLAEAFLQLQAPGYVPNLEKTPSSYIYQMMRNSSPQAGYVLLHAAEVKGNLQGSTTFLMFIITLVTALLLVSPNLFCMMSVRLTTKVVLLVCL